jgi:hypothetical protein
MSDSNEVWRPIARSGGAYEVSSLGRVRSVDREVRHPCGGVSKKRGVILKPSADRHGYLKCKLIEDGKQVERKIHRLVAQAFLPTTDLPQVNHLDFDRANNVVANLEWVNNSDNMRHAVAAGRHSSAKNPRKAKKLTVEKVAQIRVALADGRRQSEVAAEFNIHQSMVSYIANGKKWPQGAPA